MLVTIEKSFTVNWSCFDFSRGLMSSKLNLWFNSDGLQGMLEGKDYQCIDIDFQLNG